MIKGPPGRTGSPVVKPPVKRPSLNSVYVVLADSSRYRLEQGSYAVADVMAGYQVTRHLDLQVNVNNLFDRTYYSAIGTSPIWGSTDTYGNPRSFGLTAKYTF